MLIDIKLQTPTEHAVHQPDAQGQRGPGDAWRKDPARKIGSADTPARMGIGWRTHRREALLFLPGPLDTCLPGIEEIEAELGRMEDHG
jgi:hypothetical protein